MNSPKRRSAAGYTVRHILKSHPEPFNAVWHGEKGHEIRFNDRKYRVSHTARLMEYDPEKKLFLGRAIDLIITHLRFAEGEGKPFSAGLRPGFVVFDFLILNHFRKEDFPEESAAESFITPPPFSLCPNPEDT